MQTPCDGLEVGNLKCVQTELHWSTSAFDPLMAFIMSLLGKEGEGKSHYVMTGMHIIQTRISSAVFKTTRGLWKRQKESHWGLEMSSEEA